MDKEIAMYLIINTIKKYKMQAFRKFYLFKTHKNKKKNKFIVSERQYIGITATINGFRSTLASCEVLYFTCI